MWEDVGELTNTEDAEENVGNAGGLSRRALLELDLHLSGARGRFQQQL